jgi:hypothetical protein
LAATALGLTMAAGLGSIARADLPLEHWLQVANNGSGPILFRDGLTVADADVTAQVRIEEGGQAGLMVRTQDNSADPGGYYAAINATDNQLVLMKADGWGALSSCSVGLSTGQYALGMTIERQHTYELRLVTTGTVVEVYLDGVKKIECSDATYSTGGVGLRAYKAVARWDDIVITSGGASETSDFESQTTAGWTANSGTWTVVEVDPNVQPDHWLRAGNNGGPRIMRTGVTVTDVDMSADIRIESGNQVGLLLRAGGTGGDPDNGYYVALHAGTSRLLVMKVGTWGALASCSYGLSTGQYQMNLSPALELGRDYRLRATMVGTTLTAYVDGVRIAECQDSTTASGPVGMRAYQAVASWDNVLVSAGTASFFDDFEDNNYDGWTTYSSPWSIATLDDSHVNNDWYQVANNGSGPWSQYTGYTAADVDLSAEVQIRSGAEAGLLARVNGSSADPTGYYAAIKASNSTIGLMRAGSWNALSSCSLGLPTGQIWTSYTIETNKTYRLRLVTQGTTIAFYIDGTKVIECTDSQTASGGIGVRVYQATAAFDNILAAGATSASDDFEDGTGANWSTRGGTWTVAPIGGTFTPPSAKSQSTIPYPTFKGEADPMPDTGVQYVPTNYLAEIFAADLAGGAGSVPGNDFYVDRILARNGPMYDSTENKVAFTRGRAAFMRNHTPTALGFSGELVYGIEASFYWNGVNNAIALSLADGATSITLTEQPAQRRQTPSYFLSVFTGGGLTVTQVKFITHNNVMVVALQIQDTSGADRALTLTGSAPLATTAAGDELTGTWQVPNNLTTVGTRFSGDGFTVSGTRLTSTLAVPANGTVTTKVQLGLTTSEIPESTSDYEAYKALSPAAAYTQHVTAYNQWWVDNIVWVDTPENNIDKVTLYRWWLMRFNALDANIPGNDFQFPTAMEGVLGYNNSITISNASFVDDLKYFRDPAYAYGTALSMGETSSSSWLADNPGDPANWSAWHGFPYINYVGEASWRAYEVQGGPSAIAGRLAGYFEDDVNGFLEIFDTNENYLLDFDRGDITGTDADAVGFYWPASVGESARMDRTESAYIYANAVAAANFYAIAGDAAGQARMEDLASRVRSAILTILWQGETAEPDSVGLYGSVFKQRTVASGSRVPWKELGNFHPFSSGVVPTADEAGYDPAYLEALRILADANQFPIYPFYVGDQVDKLAAGWPGSNNFSTMCTTLLFRLYSAALHNWDQSYITADDYKKLLYWNAWAHYQDSGDNRLPNNNEFWWNGSAADGGSLTGRSSIHHGILAAMNNTMIEDVAGLRPRSDDTIELDPIDLDWDYLTANNVRYHGADLTIVWDATGHYGGTIPVGYSLYVDGELAFTVDSLVHVLYDSATGQVTLPDGSGTVVASAAQPVVAADQVTFAGADWVVDLFAKAGTGIGPNEVGNPNLAEGAAVTASYQSSKRKAEAAVDGTTVNEPFWGTVGSPNATDWLEVPLGGTVQVDQVKVYFYRTSSSATVAGYAAPAAYEVQYWDGAAWQALPSQVRTPAAPTGNYNLVESAAVTTTKIRLTVTHAAGAKTGVKEIQVFYSGGAQLDQITPGTPSINGVVQVGQTVTVVPGSWSPADVALAYQWQLDGVDVAGATSGSYAIQAGDVGKTLTVVVTGTKAGCSDATATASGVVVASGTITAGTPLISGTVQVGQTVTVVPGSWSPADVALSYQWQLDGVAVSGAVTSNYAVKAEDQGKTLTVAVTGTKTGYTTASAESAGAEVAAGVITPGTVTVTGTAAPGQTLTALPGMWTPSDVTLSYQWQLDG